MTTPPISPVAELTELTELLSQAQARMQLTRSRVSRSTLYDPIYHTAIVACAMRAHGIGTVCRILTPWLKLLQFVAARPTLVTPFCEYVSGRRDRNLHSWSRMPRGYLGDETHDAVVDLLVASGVLRKLGDSIEGSDRFPLLDDLANRVEAKGLFVAERAIIERLREVKVSKAMLGAS